MTSVRRASVLAAACLLAATLDSAAQQLSITGTVDDTYGVVANAAVTLRTPDGMTRQATTDGEGRYTFDELAPGNYEVAAALEGFAPATRLLTLTSQSRTVDLTLTIAGFVASVDVVDVAGQSTGSRMEIPDREIPSQVSVVSQTTLREQGVNDLAGALENVSGVITQVQYGVYEWYTISGVTQQSGNDFLHVDGMALTGNRTNSQINNVEQVQVFKGPSAVLYGGAGASQGGIVNVVRKKPQATRVNELEYKAGAWGLQQVGGGFAGQVFGLSRVFYRLDSAFSRADGWRDSGSKRFNVTPALTWLLSDQARLTFNESFTRDRYRMDAGVPVTLLAARPDFPLDRRFNPATDFQLSRDWQNQILFNSTITDHLQFRNAFFNRRNRDEYLDAESLAYNAATDTLTRGELYFQHNRRPIQNQSDLLGDYDVLGMKHRFMVGYSIANHRNYTNRIGNAAGASNALTVPIPSIRIADFLADGFVDPAPIYSSFPRTRVDHSLNRTHAAYWQDQIDVSDRVKVNLAGRYDDFRRTAHNDTYDNDAFVSEGPILRRHQTAYTYRAGAVYAVAPNHSLYASSATTFQPINTIPADNRELEPTRSRSFEVGHRFETMRGRLVATTGLRKILNYNLLLPLGGNLFEQAGKSSSRALDFDLEGSLPRGVRAVASYGYADPHFDEFRAASGQDLSGFRLPHAPKHTGRIWTTKFFELDQRSSIAASLGGRYVHDYFTNQTNTVSIPSRLTFDGAIGFRRPEWEVSLNLVNLTNKKHYFVSQINGGTQLYPGPPLNATVTLRYRFN